ncbi:restriction endonuclease subunit S [Tamlana sp. I1]|uniref:restriction endonuclease subunit S n=1 Tax=Tamlana sp. I1 TaxID=2762061 RepID=UPI00188FEC1B|nr:restriction endonuclease subunit S [Tamlana sp. I1]
MELLQPKLRFIEFKNQWIKTKLGTLGVFKGGGTPTTNKANYWQGNTPWISSSDIVENDIFNINITRYISDEAIDESAVKIVPLNSVLFVSRVGVGKLAVSNLNLCTSQDFANLTPKKDNSWFIAYYFLSKNKLLHQYAQGTSIKGFTTGDLKSIPINIPTLLEQQKIAAFLTDVDTKIAQLTKKKTFLEQYKKGIMQKIFNQELRFKDDNGNAFPDWQKNKLGKSVKFLKGKGLPKSEIVCDGQYKCIHYGELFTKYNELIDNIISRTNDNDKTILSKVNDVLMPTSDVTPNGLATASCIKESDVILGGDVLIIRQDIKKIEGVYLAHYIKHFRNDVMKLVSGSTVYHLYGSDMKNLQVLIPCLDEQIKIANFLTDLDKKIEAVTTKIEKAQTFKKGLLQQMFV